MRVLASMGVVALLLLAGVGIWLLLPAEPGGAPDAGVAGVEAPAPPDAPTTGQVLESVTARLQRQFDAHLEDPRRYVRHVVEEARQFPEGDLFPYLFPAMAYANLAISGRMEKTEALGKMAAFIDLAIPSVIRQVKPGEGKLERLASYRRNATYLGQLNLALGAFRRTGGDQRYEAMHARISGVLFQAMEKNGARPLESFPGLTWPFDTNPVLVSLKLRDEQRAEPVIEKHLAWIGKEATHPESGLPYSRRLPDTCIGWELPRGCDLSFRLCLLPHLDRGYARSQYRRYLDAFWLERGLLAGFAEWPGGMEKYADADSGPILAGIGMAATGLGIGAVIAHKDQPRLDRLAGLLSIRDQLIASHIPKEEKPLIGGTIPFHPRYYTGFLFGDAVLFYVMTWTPW
jgi:hypothetical protein